MPLIDIAAPGIEPVDLADIKASARIDGTEFDAQIPLIIKALRRQAEKHLGRRLITQTVELVLDEFPADGIDLLLPDVQAIASVKCIDTAGVPQTLASNLYALDNSTVPSWITPAYGTEWPATLPTINAVRIRFNVGYGDAAANVPEDIRLWIIAHGVQILQSPDGMTADNLKALPFVDGLLDYHRVMRAV